MPYQRITRGFCQYGWEATGRASSWFLEFGKMIKPEHRRWRKFSTIWSLDPGRFGRTDQVGYCLAQRLETGSLFHRERGGNHKNDVPCVSSESSESESKLSAPLPRVFFHGRFYSGGRERLWSVGLVGKRRTRFLLLPVRLLFARILQSGSRLIPCAFSETALFSLSHSIFHSDGPFSSAGERYELS